MKRLSRLVSIEEEINAREWFYKYSLPGGRYTKTYISDDVLRIHDTRQQMMLEVLNQSFGDKQRLLTGIDLSSHQGFFSFKLAEKIKHVTGIEMQAENVYDANLIKEALGVQNVEFRQSNLFDVDKLNLPPADIVLMFGLLYNLENPIGGLRIAKKLTKKLLLIETQTTALDLTGRVDSGSHFWGNEMMGIFGIFPGLPEAKIGSETDIILYPSPKGLIWILQRLGFSKVEILSPPQDAYEQLASGKRIMVAAYL